MATVSETLVLGLHHHQNGRLAKAELIYCQVLQIDPRHGEALQLLGVLSFQAGRPDQPSFT